MGFPWAMRTRTRGESLLGPAQEPPEDGSTRITPEGDRRVTPETDVRVIAQGN